MKIAENNFLEPSELVKQTDPGPGVVYPSEGELLTYVHTGYFGRGIYFTQFPSYGTVSTVCAARSLWAVTLLRRKICRSLQSRDAGLLDSHGVGCTFRCRTSSTRQHDILYCRHI